MGLLRRDKKDEKVTSDDYYGINELGLEGLQQQNIDHLAYLLSEEENVKQLLAEGLDLTDDNLLKYFGPALSRAIRLTNIDKTDKLIYQTSFKINVGLLKTQMKKSKYNLGYNLLLRNLEIFAATVINDAMKGWKTKAVTVRRRAAEVTVERKKRGLFR